MKSFSEVKGVRTRDAGEDVRFILQQLRSAGIVNVLAFDLTLDEIRPARVVRVLAPGLETFNALYNGPRARVTFLKDLLPGPHPCAENGGRDTSR